MQRREPLDAAAAAIERALADAHESGDPASVRLLHALLAVLSASTMGLPRVH